MAQDVIGGNSIQFLKTQNIALAQGSNGTLRQGNVVFVRVIQSNGNGSYVVSFGGNRFNVKSEQNLLPGQSFPASVNLADNGTVELVMMASKNDFAQSSSVANLLMAQGFSSDDITKKILLMMTQSGFKVNKDIIAAAKKIARLFPGKEKLAGEIAAILLQKGIEPSEEAVSSILFLLEEKNESSDKDPRDEGESGDSSVPEDAGNLLSRIYGNDPSLSQAVPGILTMINQVKSGNRHWIFLPYEYEGGKASGSGIISVLLDLESKTTEKIQINYKNGLKSYSFILYCNNSKVKEIRFCTLPPLLTPDILKEEKRLGELFSSGMNNNISVPVTYSSSAFIEGFCANGESLPLVDQKA